MKIYHFKGIAREKGAIGVLDRFQCRVLGTSYDNARLKLYDTWERIAVTACVESPLEVPLATTYRNGDKRVSYRPDWSPSRPWISHTAGTAGRHFTSKSEALEWLNS